MKLLEEKIILDGEIRSGNVVKVDSFLNHRVEPRFLEKLGIHLAKYFSRKNPSLVLTLEASGIALAYETARALELPLVFAKKAASLNLDHDTYTAEVYSYTRQDYYNIKVSKKYISSDDKVLIVDDFLARGSACNGLIKICEAAGAEVVGLGIAVEKYFQGGGKALREAGYDLESLAIIESMSGNGEIRFIGD